MDLPTRDFPDQLYLIYIRLEYLSMGSHSILHFSSKYCLFVRLKAPLVYLVPVLAQSRLLLPK